MTKPAKSPNLAKSPVVTAGRPTTPFQMQPFPHFHNLQLLVFSFFCMPIASSKRHHYPPLSCHQEEPGRGLIVDPGEPVESSNAGPLKGNCLVLTTPTETKPICCFFLQATSTHRPSSGQQCPREGHACFACGFVDTWKKGF